MVADSVSFGEKNPTPSRKACTPDGRGGNGPGKTKGPMLKSIQRTDLNRFHLFRGKKTRSPWGKRRVMAKDHTWSTGDIGKGMLSREKKDKGEGECKMCLEGGGEAGDGWVLT